MARRILLIGGTGLVGSRFAESLAGEGNFEIEALVRRPSGLGAPGYREHVAPPADWPEKAGGLGAEIAVSALGTTMRAAGSKDAFRAVDFDLVVDFAAAARAAGARHMIIVSSVGADAGSRNFYLRTKGEMERALEALDFERLDIVRPGLLRGQRGGERRPGERLGIIVSPLLNLLLRGRLDRYAAIDGTIVAAAMAALAGQDEPGRRIHHNRDLHRLASGRLQIAGSFR